MSSSKRKTAKGTTTTTTTTTGSTATASPKEPTSRSMSTDSTTTLTQPIENVFPPPSSSSSSCSSSSTMADASMTHPTTSATTTQSQSTSAEEEQSSAASSSKQSPAKKRKAKTSKKSSSSSSTTKAKKNKKSTTTSTGNHDNSKDDIKTYNDNHEEQKEVSVTTNNEKKSTQCLPTKILPVRECRNRKPEVNDCGATTTTPSSTSKNGRISVRIRRSVASSTGKRSGVVSSASESKNRSVPAMKSNVSPSSRMTCAALIQRAIVALNKRQGCSPQSLHRYICENFTDHVNPDSLSLLPLVRRTLKVGVENGVFIRLGTHMFSMAPDARRKLRIQMKADEALNRPMKSASSSSPSRTMATTKRKPTAKTKSKATAKRTATTKGQTKLKSTTKKRSISAASSSSSKSKKRRTTTKVKAVSKTVAARKRQAGAKRQILPMKKWILEILQGSKQHSMKVKVLKNLLMVNHKEDVGDDVDRFNKSFRCVLTRGCNDKVFGCNAEDPSDDKSVLVLL